jgi:hypothetical protein
MRKLLVVAAVLVATTATAVLATAARAGDSAEVPVPWCSAYRPGLDQNVR